MAKKPKLTPQECADRAADCRAMAETARSKEHQAILRHMTDSWERIRSDLQTSNERDAYE